MDTTRPAALDATLADAVAAIDAGLAASAPAALAAPLREPPPSARFVQFTIASTVYAVPQTLVVELDRVPAITTVPQTPAWLRGVANLRGDVLSVIDLRTWLGLDATSSHTGRMLVVRLLDEDFSVGLLVDGVEQLLTLELDAVRPPASPLEGPLSPYLKGVCVAADRLVAVIDLERLLRSADIRQFDDAKEDSSCEAR